MSISFRLGWRSSLLILVASTILLSVGLCSVAGREVHADWEEDIFGLFQQHNELHSEGEYHQHHHDHRSERSGRSDHRDSPVSRDPATQRHPHNRATRTADAQVCEWIGGQDGRRSWLDADNWKDGVIPTSGDDVLIQLDGPHDAHRGHNHQRGQHRARAGEQDIFESMGLGGANIESFVSDAGLSLALPPLTTVHLRSLTLNLGGANLALRAQGASESRAGIPSTDGESIHLASLTVDRLEVVFSSDSKPVAYSALSLQAVRLNVTQWAEVRLNEPASEHGVPTDALASLCSSAPSSLPHIFLDSASELILFSTARSVVSLGESKQRRAEELDQDYGIGSGGRSKAYVTTRDSAKVEAEWETLLRELEHTSGFADTRTARSRSSPSQDSPPEPALCIMSRTRDGLVMNLGKMRLDADTLMAVRFLQPDLLNTELALARKIDSHQLLQLEAGTSVIFTHQADLQGGVVQLWDSSVEEDAWRAATITFDGKGPFWMSKVVSSLGLGIGRGKVAGQAGQVASKAASWLSGLFNDQSTTTAAPLLAGSTILCIGLDTVCRLSSHAEVHVAVRVTNGAAIQVNTRPKESKKANNRRSAFIARLTLSVAFQQPTSLQTWPVLLGNSAAGRRTTADLQVNSLNIDMDMANRPGRHRHHHPQENARAWTPLVVSGIRLHVKQQFVMVPGHETSVILFKDRGHILLLSSCTSDIGLVDVSRSTGYDGFEAKAVVFRASASSWGVRNEGLLRLHVPTTFEPKLQSGRSARIDYDYIEGGSSSDSPSQRISSDMDVETFAATDIYHNLHDGAGRIVDAIRGRDRHAPVSGPADPWSKGASDIRAAASSVTRPVADLGRAVLSGFSDRIQLVYTGAFFMVAAAMLVGVMAALMTSNTPLLHSLLSVLAFMSLLLRLVHSVPVPLPAIVRQVVCIFDFRYHLLVLHRLLPIDGISATRFLLLPIYAYIGLWVLFVISHFIFGLLAKWLDPKHSKSTQVYHPVWKQFFAVITINNDAKLEHHVAPQTLLSALAVKDRLVAVTEILMLPFRSIWLHQPLVSRMKSLNRYLEKAHFHVKTNSHVLTRTELEILKTVMNRRVVILRRVEDQKGDGPTLIEAEQYTPHWDELRRKKRIPPKDDDDKSERYYQKPLFILHHKDKYQLLQHLAFSPLDWMHLCSALSSHVLSFLYVSWLVLAPFFLVLLVSQDTMSESIMTAYFKDPVIQTPVNILWVISFLALWIASYLTNEKTGDAAVDKKDSAPAHRLHPHHHRRHGLFGHDDDDDDHDHHHHHHRYSLFHPLHSLHSLVHSAEHALERAARANAGLVRKLHLGGNILTPSAFFAFELVVYVLPLTRMSQQALVSIFGLIVYCTLGLHGHKAHCQDHDNGSKRHSVFLLFIGAVNNGLVLLYLLMLPLRNSSPFLRLFFSVFEFAWWVLKTYFLLYLLFDLWKQGVTHFYSRILRRVHELEEEAPVDPILPEEQKPEAKLRPTQHGPKERREDVFKKVMECVKNQEFEGIKSFSKAIKAVQYSNNAFSLPKRNVLHTFRQTEIWTRRYDPVEAYRFLRAMHPHLNPLMLLSAQVLDPDSDLLKDSTKSDQDTDLARRSDYLKRLGDPKSTPFVLGGVMLDRVAVLRDSEKQAFARYPEPQYVDVLAIPPHASPVVPPHRLSDYEISLRRDNLMEHDHIGGLGHCLFLTFSYFRTGSPKWFQFYRDTVANYIEHHKSNVDSHKHNGKKDSASDVKVHEDVSVTKIFIKIETLVKAEKGHFNQKKGLVMIGEENRPIRNLQEYADAIRANGWASDDREVELLSTIFKCNFKIYQKGDNEGWWTIPENIDPKHPTYTIGQTKNHFFPLVPKGEKQPAKQWTPAEIQHMIDNKAHSDHTCLACEKEKVELPPFELCHNCSARIRPDFMSLSSPSPSPKAPGSPSSAPVESIHVRIEKCSPTIRAQMQAALDIAVATGHNAIVIPQFGVADIGAPAVMDLWHSVLEEFAGYFASVVFAIEEPNAFTEFYRLDKVVLHNPLIHKAIPTKLPVLVCTNKECTARDRDEGHVATYAHLPVCPLGKKCPRFILKIAPFKYHADNFVH